MRHFAAVLTLLLTLVLALAASASARPVPDQPVSFGGVALALAFAVPTPDTKAPTTASRHHRCKHRRNVLVPRTCRPSPGPRP